MKKISPLPGDTIDFASRYACETATSFLEVVEFSFNGWSCKVAPFSNPVTIANKYRANIGIKTYKCKNSQERIIIETRFSKMGSVVEKIDFFLSLLPPDDVIPDVYSELDAKEFQRLLKYWFEHFLWLKFNDHKYSIGVQEYLEVKERVLSLKNYLQTGLCFDSIDSVK